MLSGSPRECAHRSASVHAARLLCMHFHSLKNLYLHFPLISFIVPIIILFAWVKSIIQNFDTFTCIWISLLRFRSLNSRKSWDGQANWTRLSVNKGTARSLSDYNYHIFISFLIVIAKFSYQKGGLDKNRPIRQDRNPPEDKNIDSLQVMSRISDRENGRRIRRIDVLQELSRIE